MPTRVDYDGDSGYERHVNPQRTVSPLPLRKSAILETINNVQNARLIPIEAQHIEREIVFMTAAALRMFGKPEEVKKDNLPADIAPITEHDDQLRNVVSHYNADAISELQLEIDALNFSLCVMHQVGRLQAANYQGKPPAFEPSLVPVFLADCRDNMRNDIVVPGNETTPETTIPGQTLADYISDRLEIEIEGYEFYEPDEMTQLRTIVPAEDRKRMRTGTTKAFSPDELRRLRAKRKEWTTNIEDGSDQIAFADLLESTRQFADAMVDYHFPNLYPEGTQTFEERETKRDRIKETTYHLVNLGFYFGYWTYMHHQGVNEIKDTFSLE